ncbi:MAG: PQQ-binding-like beta-propeller repeat protein [Spirochaetota bacterium]
MNRWADDKELYSEIAGYAGDSADALFTLLHNWQSSLPALRDTGTYNDIIEQSRTSKSYSKQILSVVAAGVAAIVIFGIVLFNRFMEKPAQSHALCKAVVGNVMIQRGKENIHLTNGMEVLQSDIIVCDKSSMAVIEIGSATLHIDANSKVSLDSLQQKQVLSLATSMDKGILYATVQKLQKGDSVLVKTKTAVAGIRGTSFLVKSDSQSTKLVVLDGKVILSPRLQDSQQEDITGVVVDGGKSCVIDTRTLRTIQKAIREKKVSLDEAIQESIPVSVADEKAINVLHALNQDVSEVVIDEEKPSSINDLYPIVSITPFRNAVVVTTNNSIYYCENNLIKWTQDFYPLSKPYIWDDFIIFQSKMLQALDTKGNSKWAIEIEGNSIGDSIVQIRDKLVIPTTKGLLYFISKNGKILHRVDCNAPIVSRPISFGQMVCVVTADGYLYAIDIVLGVSIYRKHIGKVLDNGIFARYPEIYIVTPASIQKIHLLRDEIIWRHDDSEIVAAVEHPQGIVFATAKGTLGKITTNGTLEWRINPGKEIHSLQYTSKGIVCIAENVFYQISDSGEVLWSYTLPTRNTEILSVTPKTVYIRSGNSFLALRL